MRKFFYLDVLYWQVSNLENKMNINNSNLNFAARFTVWGKQNPSETAKVYNQGSKKDLKNGDIAVQAQYYFQTPFIQDSIKQLPADTFVRLHTGILDGEDKKEDKILGFTPFVSFETNKINEQGRLQKALDGADSLKLSLDENGDLNTAAINEWFGKVINYYS